VGHAGTTVNADQGSDHRIRKQAVNRRKLRKWIHDFTRPGRNTEALILKKSGAANRKLCPDLASRLLGSLFTLFLRSV
jgi:hypothetical protein